ncbi:MAG: hypothetical protein CMM30_06120 [Rhodospirillaceae bacterium]|nr:hypothetical protein [Rhodospirillaceae bacterium]
MVISMLNYSCRDQSELIGHAEAEKELIHSWNNGNIPNAWIFSGPKGIGKATLGYRLARFILAKENEYISNQEGLWVDPNSSTFKRISAGTHSDLFTLELTENEQGILRNEIVINDVRRLNRFLSLTSGESSWKIVIIDGADFLNSSAENALLKHIEETPYKSVFILVTHSLDKLLPTTRSR